MSYQLFYGDNLDVLREHIADESVDQASVKRAKREETGRQEWLI